MGLFARRSADVKAGLLSGGQRQRVAFARAIIVPPKLLLCDEPTSALDASLAASVLNLLQDLRRELGMAVMFVTHDLAAARFISDRTAVMYLGQIVEVGPTVEVISNPKHPYTKALLAAIPSPGTAPVRLRGEPASPFAVPTGCSFHPRCPNEPTGARPKSRPSTRSTAPAGVWRRACSRWRIGKARSGRRPSKPVMD